MNAPAGGLSDGLADRLAAAEVEVGRGVPLGPLTTYRVGGPAEVLVRVRSLPGLRHVAAVLRASKPPVLVLGRGSNLLVADRGFAGVVVALDGDLDVVRIDGAEVEAAGSTSLPVVARRSVSAGLTGFEWAVGVPGSIGGAVRMNAGGHGSDMASSLCRVHIVDLHSGDDGVVAANALELGYRRSAIEPAQVVAAATLSLQPGDKDRSEAELREIVRWRRAHQPGGQNAGSVFTNPAGDSAGRLIDQAGLRGHRIGSARVSEKHANFIQADDDGSADDIRRLMDHVRGEVRAACGVDLHVETHLVGFGDR